MCLCLCPCCRVAVDTVTSPAALWLTFCDHFPFQKTRADELKAAGTAAYRKREFEEALRLYGEADEVNPDGANISYRLNQAAVHFELKAYDECIAVCTKAIDDGRDSGAAFPMLAKAYARIGNANVRKGDFPAAIEAYERSLMESHSDDVYTRLKRTKADMKKAEEQAYLDPEKAKEAKEAGNELFKAGDFKGAIEQYSDAIRRDPTQAVYYANRGAARTKIMDFNEAMKDVDKAIELDPKYVRAYSRKGALQVCVCCCSLLLLFVVVVRCCCSS